MNMGCLSIYLHPVSCSDVLLFSVFLAVMFCCFQYMSLAFLVKFIPTYFILFDVIVNEIVFLVFFLANSLLIYWSVVRNATDFSMPIFYSTTVLNLFISSNSFFMKSSRFSTCKISSFVNREKFTSSIPLDAFYIYLSIYLSYATEIRFIRDFCEKLCASKLYNLKEMDKFLETYNVSKMNHKETENLNRPITTTEIKSIIKMLPTRKGPRPDGFIGKFYEVLKEELTPVFLSLGRFLTIISSNMLSVLFSLFSFWTSHNAYLGLLCVIP